MKKALFFLLCFISRQIIFAVEFPYPKLQKLYDKGKYEECHEKIGKKITSVPEKNKIWLYCLDMRCYLAEYKEKNNWNTVKKAWNAGKKMMHKYEGELPDYMLNALTEFYEKLRLEFAKNEEKNSTAILNVYSNLFSTFRETEAAWQAWQTLNQTGQWYNAISALQGGLDRDPAQRNAGRLRNFEKGYLAWFRYKLHTGDLPSVTKYYRQGVQLYPESDSFCLVICKEMAENAEVFPKSDAAELAAFYELNDLLQANRCHTDKVREAWELSLFTASCQQAQASQALMSANWLNQHFPNIYDTAWFRERLILNLPLNPGPDDSVRLLAALHIKSAFNLEQTPGVITWWCLHAVDEGNLMAANALLLLYERGWKNNKKEIANTRNLIRKKTDLLLKSGKNINRRSILDFYYLHPKNAENKKAFISYVQQFVSLSLGTKNYGECMRMLKSALRFYPGDANLIKLQRSFVIADFTEHYQRKAWKYEAEIIGLNTSTCTPGKVSDSFQAQFLDMLNYIRRLAGVYDSCTLNPVFNKKAQQAALIMSANYYLTHSVPRDAKCYSADGAAGASSSNLSLGHNGISALLGQVDDDGGNNSSVGHRRWILNPNNTVFGHGSAPGSMALYVFGGYDKKGKSVFNDTQDFIAWPVAGAFPATLLPARWSFSFTGADFTNATVSVKSGGKTIAAPVESRNGGYGLSTIVWSPDVQNQTEFDVEIKQVQVVRYDMEGKTRIMNFSYHISLIR